MLTPSEEAVSVSDVTPAEYEKLCDQLGTRDEAAAILGITRMTLFRRIEGKTPLTKEIEFAARWAVHRKGKV